MFSSSSQNGKTRVSGKESEKLNEYRSNKLKIQGNKNAPWDA